MEWSRRISLRILFMHNTYYLYIFSLKFFVKTSILTAPEILISTKTSEISLASCQFDITKLTVIPIFTWVAISQSHPAHVYCPSFPLLQRPVTFPNIPKNGSSQNTANLHEK